MNARELLAQLEGLGVELTADEGRLRVSAARGRLDDELKHAIGEHKPELLALLAQRRPPAAGPVASVAHDGPLPLSPFQERLWILQQLEPDSTTYLMATTWLAPLGVSGEALVAAIERVHARQLGLRMVFVEEQGKPWGRRVDVPQVRVHDLRHLTPTEQKWQIDADVERVVHTPIDLTRETPARFEVYATAGDTWVVMVAAHHIAVDAWSLHVLRREITAELAAPGRGQGETPVLQYADYAAWQRSAVDTSAGLDWWERTLQGSPQLSAFPADLPLSDAPARGASVDFELDAELVSGLHQLVRRENATVYMAMLAATVALLRAHTGQGDLLLGSPMGVRERAEFENLVGPFVNLQVVRLQVGDDPGFGELLRRARNALFDAHEHRQVSFESVLERLKPARSFQHSPLFQVAVVQHNVNADGQDDQSGLAITGGGALHELTWFAREQGGRLVCSLEYRSDLYSSAMMERLASQLQALLRGAVATPDAPVSRLPLLTPAAREQLVHGFNQTTRSLDGTLFAQRLERQAAQSPERIAAGFEGQTLDYASLNRRANQLAHHLQGLGVRPGVRVGICMDRSLDLLVALLAVHKSGGAYVPLDPDFPAERLAYMLEDSGARVLLTSGEAADAVSAPDGVRCVDPLADATAIAAHSGDNPAPAAQPGDAAYVIYTSGSTGRPKGVVVPQGALANFLASMALQPGLSADDVLAAVTTVSFDIAGLELYLPLTVGARVELASRDTVTDGVALAEWLTECQATVLQATPATWRLLLEAEWTPARPLRAFCGGEPLPRDLADRLLERVDQLWNLYGPTETTIWSTVHQVEPAPAPISIGRPIANTQIHVLNAHGEPVPIGVPGELCIGGAGVATGYHERAELTAERFVADRFSAQPGARLYRTGDLARWDAQGRLHHLGRLDHQVKVRGYRIELGEIEAALSAHPAVRQAVVMGREAGPADVRLVAYLAFQPGEDLTASDVRRFLRKQLPDYMIPSVVAAVDAIPLTPNGKVDRAALPDPFRNAVQTARDYVAPEPGHEQVMADIWREILQVDRVGAEDNFFELGGHSLLSLRVAQAVEKRLGWRMDARTLFFQNLRQVVAVAAAEKGTLQE
ncbi:MAG: amino acid adenylation domain-containing protein [Burkholderiaceae bacterium]|nr:amino acid adenylation domain-containing protein [Burkholderiaceae bacterium]